MTKPKPPALPPELRALCGRLAVERTRRQQWDMARDLRLQVLERIRRGEDPGALVAELVTAISMAARLRSWPPMMETKAA